MRDARGRWIAVAALMLACSNEPNEPPAISSGSGVSTATGSSTAGTGDASSTSTSSVTGSVTSSASGDGSTAAETEGGPTSTTTGASAECRACWAGACADEVDACAANDGCACQLNCGQDTACVQACAANPPFTDLLACIVDSSVGPCVDVCEASCEACFVRACPDEFEACTGDTVCICQVWCDGNETCKSNCGPASPIAEDLDLCFAEVAGKDCAGPC